MCDAEPASSSAVCIFCWDQGSRSGIDEGRGGGVRLSRSGINMDIVVRKIEKRQSSSNE